MELNERIALARKQAGMTQEQLGEQLGVSRQAVSKWESAQTNPDVTYVAQMCRLLGVSAGWLLLGEETELPGNTHPRTQQPKADGERLLRIALLALGAAVLLHPMLHWLSGGLPGGIRDNAVLGMTAILLAAALKNMGSAGMFRKGRGELLWKSPLAGACLAALMLEMFALLLDIWWLILALGPEGHIAHTVFEFAGKDSSVHITVYRAVVGVISSASQKLALRMILAGLVLHGALLWMGRGGKENTGPEENRDFLASIAAALFTCALQTVALLVRIIYWKTPAEASGRAFVWGKEFLMGHPLFWVIFAVGMAGAVRINFSALCCGDFRQKCLGWCNLLTVMLLEGGMFYWLSLSGNIGSETDFNVCVTPSWFMGVSLLALLPRRGVGVLCAWYQRKRQIKQAPNG